MKNNETIDHPEYYRRNGLEAIDVIERHNLNFNLGSVVKYLWRMGLKYGESMGKDISKAYWYLDREVKRLCGLTLSRVKKPVDRKTAVNKIISKLRKVFIDDCDMTEAYEIVVEHLSKAA